jgi:TusA-related sulfurtransferase
MKKSTGLFMKNVRPDITIDVRDLISPISLLTVEKTLTTMSRGQVAEVLCGDRETREDLLDILRNSNDRYMGMDETPDYVVLFIEKKS